MSQISSQLVGKANCYDLMLNLIKQELIINANIMQTVLLLYEIN